MIITKPGKYRLLEDITNRSPISISIISKGEIIEVTQVDDIYHKVIGPPLFDWHRWDMPVEEMPLPDPPKEAE